MTAAQLAIPAILGGCITPNRQHRRHGHENLTGEYVLLRRLPNMRGYRVQQIVHHHDGSITYANFGVIDQEPPASATEVLMQGGHGTNYLEGLRWHVFNQSSRPMLNDTGERLRLVNAQGHVVEEKVFAANSCDVLPAAPQPARPPQVVSPTPSYSPYKARK